MSDLYGNIYTRSDAVLRIFHHLGGAWRLLAIFRIFPKPLRDLFYRFLAKYCYRWFGKHEQCRVPTAEERVRFLE